MSAAPLRWQRAVADLHAAGVGFVLVTVLETRGSTPRCDDSKMVVTGEAAFDTVGGGRLEFHAIDVARRMIETGTASKTIEEFSLGPKFDQCCGGHVTLLFEYFPAPSLTIELHGAGHVGRALVKIFSEIDCRVRWIDERPGAFPDAVAGNVTCVSARAAAGEVDAAPAAAWHLVMTHSHPLDLEIVEAVLSRGDARYLGLIGSRSKAVRFRRRLEERGFGGEELARLECPIGIGGIGGKEPMRIAVAVAADILARHHGASATRTGAAALALARG